MKKLNLRLNWHNTIGGTKDGLFQLARAVQMIAEKQDEIIAKINELELAEPTHSQGETDHE